MRIVVASDYHWTLAGEVERGIFKVPDAALAKVREFTSLGGVFVLATSGSMRHIGDLASLLRGIAYIALENGLILVKPDGSIVNNAPGWWRPVKESIVNELSRLGIGFTMGYEAIFLKAHDVGGLGLEDRYPVKLEYNRGLVSVMPRGVDKGFVVRVLRGMFKGYIIVAVGDAENDLSMFREADIAVAVANALDVVKGEADYVTDREDGLGVAEVLDAAIRCGEGLRRCLDSDARFTKVH